jgi:hypothetical protein
MDSGDNIGGSVVVPMFAYSFRNSVRQIPSTAHALLILQIMNSAEEFDVTGREEIKSTIHVDDTLSGLQAFALHQLLETSRLVVVGRNGHGRGRWYPSPHISTGAQARFIGSVVPNPRDGFFRRLCSLLRRA